MILSLNFIGDMLLMRTKIMLFRDYAIRRYAELEKYDNIPLENVILTPVENQRYSLYKIIKKYYPCGKFYWVLFTFAVWLLLVYLINKRAQLKK